MEAHYQFVIWLALTIEKFPKSHKFTVGDRIDGIALDVLEAPIEVTCTRERKPHLQRANLEIEELRFLLAAVSPLHQKRRPRKGSTIMQLYGNVLTIFD